MDQTIKNSNETHFNTRMKHNNETKQWNTTMKYNN